MPKSMALDIVVYNAKKRRSLPVHDECNGSS